ncbi:MAG: hypothetical protein PHE73_09320 [Sulfurovaceae bacterium]|nr:hypothetical protein [Sulfurovaceae bacterium]
MEKIFLITVLLSTNLLMADNFTRNESELIITIGQSAATIINSHDKNVKQLPSYDRIKACENQIEHDNSLSRYSSNHDEAILIASHACSKYLPTMHW